MKQILLSIKTGKMSIEEFPVPVVKIDVILVKNNISNFVRAELYKVGKVCENTSCQDKCFINTYKRVITTLRKEDNCPIDLNGIIYATLMAYCIRKSNMN